MRRLVALLGIVLVAAACGGGGGTHIYTKQATAACLQKAGVRVTPVTDAQDFVASTATGGALRAYVSSSNFVTVSFGLTLVDASNIEQAYVSFHASNVGIDDVLKTQQNAVMLWHAHPSDADISAITDCLKS